MRRLSVKPTPKAALRHLIKGVVRGRVIPCVVGEPDGDPAAVVNKLFAERVYVGTGEFRVWDISATLVAYQWGRGVIATRRYGTECTLMEECLNYVSRKVTP